MLWEGARGSLHWWRVSGLTGELGQGRFLLLEPLALALALAHCSCAAPAMLEPSLRVYISLDTSL